MDYAEFLIEKRLQEDKYFDNNDRQKDINELVRMKQEYIDDLRKELYKEEVEKYKFLNKYTDYNKTNSIQKKKDLLIKNDFHFNYTEKEDIDLMVETRYNKLMYGLFDRISRIFLERGMAGLGNYDDIRERTIIDNLLMLSKSINELEKFLDGEE